MESASCRFQIAKNAKLTTAAVDHCTLLHADYICSFTRAVREFSVASAASGPCQMAKLLRRQVAPRRTPGRRKYPRITMVHYGPKLRTT